jgi:putative ABC transport system permease protein
MNLRFFHRFAALFRRDQLDADLNAEIVSHLDEAIADNLKSGMSPQEARRRALIAFGGPQQAKENHREARSLPIFETFVQDARFALRILRKSPSFTLVAILTLALGIGATTAIFSVVYGVLLRPLPFHNPQQIVRVWEQNETGDRMRFADPNFEDVRAQNHALSGMAAFDDGLSTITGHSEPARRQVAYVSRDFLKVMAVQPVFGRSFAPEEQQPNAPATALISYAYWQQALAGTRDLSSVQLKIDQQPLSVIGVLPPGFRYPDNSDFWIPRETVVQSPSRTAHNAEVIARLRDGVSLTSARAELTAIAQRLKQQFSTDTSMAAVALDPLRDAMTSDVRPALLILLIASAFLLLIACANVTNLMLAQAASRERELAIRSALGAPRRRLVRQFLTESFLLSFIGGAFGVLLAYWGLNGLLAIAPDDLPRLDEISLSLPVLAFSLAVVVLVSVTLAVFAALRSVTRDSREALSEGSRGGIGTVARQRARRILAAAQLATALVLLVGATLLGRSLLRVLSVNSGFRTENVITMELGLPSDTPAPQRIAFLNQLLSRLQQIPGVAEVGGTNNLPLSSSFFANGSFALVNPSQITPHFRELIQRSIGANLDKDPALYSELVSFFDGLFRDKSQQGYANYVVASSGYFSTLNIPLRQGRLFDQRDTIDAPHVALINESLAKQTWPGQDPLGRTIEFGNMDNDLRLLTIVGVVGDIHDRSLETAPLPTVYVNCAQRPRVTWDFTVVLHTAGNPDSVFAAARGALRDLDPNVPPRFRTLSDVYSSSLAARRFSLTLIGIFSFAALLLALAGIYGVISYSVAQRTREIGVRMALGATTREVLALILKQGIATGAIGVVAGLVASVVVTRWLQSQLFQVSATDPVTLTFVSLSLLLVTLTACAIPARRASRVDPVVALRCE